MTNDILTSVEDRILKITFNRPTKKNAITAAMYGVMADAMASAQTDDGVRAILFTANGDAFTAGNDLMDFKDRPPLTEEAPVSRFLHQLLVAEKPLVAAVNGIAVGVGLTMLLHCDLVYMAEGAQLQAPFVDLALVPEAGSSLLLPARVGHVRAAEMFMLGKRVSAAEAKVMGLVNDVFAVDLLLPAAEKATAALTKKAPEALRQTKGLMRGNLSLVSERMVEESKVFSAQLQSPELLEAVTAFMQKREPNFG
jgi:enoyl-CoA hydratase/carnithine racemase